MKKVFLSVGADLIHGGHIAIIEKAAALGELTVGVLTDEVVMQYRGYPLLPYEERCKIINGIKGVARIVPKTTLSYDTVLKEEKPDYIVHGDVWRGGTKEELEELLKIYGGELIEYPYAQKEEYHLFEKSIENMRNMPDIRRSALKRLLRTLDRPLRVLEAHNGLTGLIVEKAKVKTENETRMFDAVWVSSLCDSTAKGKPDIELVDMTSRVNTINEIMEVTTKPIILDADTGGITEHFVYNIKTIERLGVSAVIIEDKVGLKQNSLFGNEVPQQMADVEEFCEKIKAGKAAQTTNSFMIIARIESLILEKGMEDALRRASAYVNAGADGIMIHSRKKSPEEVIRFCKLFREMYSEIPVVAVPTTYNTTTEKELAEAGVNVVIYANHLIRSAFPAMLKTAEQILYHERAAEADEQCMPIKEILHLL